MIAPDPITRPPRAMLVTLLVSGLLGQLAFAQTDSNPARIAPSTPTAPTSTNRFSFVDYIDRTHDAIDSRIIDFGLSMDAALTDSFRKPTPRPPKIPVNQFVSDRRSEEDNPSSRVKVTPSLKLRDSEGFDFGIRINGKLRLPRFEDRLALVISSIDEGESILDDLDRSQTVRSSRDRESTASLRYYLKETLNYKASLDAGLRFHPEPDPRLSLRLRVHHDFEKVTTRFTQTFFYEAIDGFGEKSQFDIDQQKPQKYLRRLSTTVLWSEDSDGVEAGQSYAYYWYLSNRRVIGLRTGITGVLEPSMQVDNFTARTLYRQRVHRDWMYLEVEPGVDFPRDRDFQATGFVNVKLDIIFGDWKEDR